jgi:hypothetical protein
LILSDVIFNVLEYVISGLLLSGASPFFTHQYDTCKFTVLSGSLLTVEYDTIMSIFLFTPHPAGKLKENHTDPFP